MMRNADLLVVGIMLAAFVGVLASAGGTLWLLWLLVNL